MALSPETLAAFRANAKANNSATSEQDTETSAEVAPPQENVFNVYKSTMLNHKLIRPDGKTIHILNGQLITADPEDIAYLDSEIKLGFPYLKPAEKITSTELDPMASLRAKIKAELLTELAEEEMNAHLNKDLGISKPAIVKPASTDKLAATTAESSSSN